MGDQTSSIIEFFTLPDAGFLMTYLIAFIRNSTSSPKATDSMRGRQQREAEDQNCFVRMTNSNVLSSVAYQLRLAVPAAYTDDI